jgi:carbon storage regulator
MLVLSRKKNESIVIGEGEDQVVLTIVEIRGDKVRLGVVAKPSVPVHREEVYKAIRQAKEEKDGTKNLSEMSKENPA